MHCMDANEVYGEKPWQQLHKNAVSKSWRQHCTKQQLYSHLSPITKLSKLDQPDMWDTAEEVGMNS